MTSPNDDVIMSIADVAHYLKVSRARIYYLVKQKEIPCFKVGERHRFRKSEIDAHFSTKAYSAPGTPANIDRVLPSA